MVRALREVDSSGGTALLCAAKGRCPGLLREGGSSIEEVDYEGDTALLRAASWGHIPVVKWLLREGGSAL